jgi:pimeloyl-ACP methyl ester carboxylesterase
MDERVSESYDRPLPGTAFVDRYVEVDGYRVRYQEAGDGPPLVSLHGAGGPYLTESHDLLASEFRVIAIEVPGFGESAPNERSQSVPELALTIGQVVRALGLDRYNLWGTSFGGRLSLWLAIQTPEGIDALVLESPAAILPPGPPHPPPSPEELKRRLFAYPERVRTFPPGLTDPDVRAKQGALLRRLGTPTREETEARLGEVAIPTLVVFGTRDAQIPPEMGRVYRERMPRCQYVLVYDAGHEVSVDRPEAFSTLVADFLQRHEVSMVSQRSSLLLP